MKKSIFLLPFLMAGTAYAQITAQSEPIVDYNVYSQKYNECIRLADSDISEKCGIEEYYLIKQKINEVVNKIQNAQEFDKYNKTELSLPANVENMLKYNDIYCKYMYEANNHESSATKCKMRQANFLYVDLYKIYEDLLKKRQKNSLNSL